MTVNFGRVSMGSLVAAIGQDGERVDLRSPATAFAIVRLDVVDGLRPTFEPVGGEALSFVEGYEPMVGVSEPIASVGWTYDCKHVEALGQVGDPKDLPLGAVPPTGRQIRIEGVTLLRDQDDSVEIRRYVDWNLVLAELGVMASFRPGRASRSQT